MSGIQLETFKPKGHQFDKSLLINAFNYEVEVETNSGTFVINIYPGLSTERIQLPFGRLEFGLFAKNMMECLEGFQRRQQEEESPIDERHLNNGSKDEL